MVNILLAKISDEVKSFGSIKLMFVVMKEKWFIIHVYVIEKVFLY
ncbi:hypothetical protein [Clostridium beijerinckii]|nr:hypothetical protein [Clostridium beijerinckii]NRT54005.1 hypothetical protein [Clostridium beijerinckii]NRU19759.1 hypothetical protein [Clostridium beijerinckii]NRW58905.1 hypothetical protein [Clostridium beijerinckii]NRW73702.1 hypothetical protein [Clostridium beijerinckii]NRW83203.1 hypothetical protein [Clostridium beijerinckii]